MIRLLLLLALLSLGAGRALASTPCTSGDGTQTGCYAQRATCSWDYLVSGTCIQGAPTTCESYFTDATGCASSPTLCALSTQSGRCYTRAPACSTLTSTGCGQRSDCTYSGGACTATPSGCGVYATGAPCGNTGCYWDVYTSIATGSPPTSGGGQCFGNLQEVNLIWGCSRWSGYPLTTFNGNPVNLACSAHGCGLVGGQCVAVDAGTITADGGTQLSTLIDFAVVNAQLNPQTLVFNADISIPMSNFWAPLAPIYTMVVIGDVLLTPGNFPPASQQYLRPGLCTSVLSLPAQAASTFSDLTTLYSYFITRVQATHSLPFNTTDVRDVAISAILGKYNFNSATGPVYGADIPAGLTNVLLHVGGNLAAWANSCGVTKTVAPTYTQYVVPITILTQTTPLPGSGSSMYMQDTARLSHTISTYGSVTISATSAAARTIAVTSVVDQQLDCAAGLMRRVFVITEQWAAVDPTQVVGLRSAADIVPQPGSGVGTPYNCFGTQPTSVTQQACSGGICTTVATFRTRCVNVPTDGSAFTNCANAQAADRIADMGANVAYPTALNGVQTFYQFPRSWSAATGITDPNYTNAGFDSTGVTPDTVTVNIQQRTYPVFASTFSLSVLAGLLPIPESPLTSLVVLSNTTGQGTYLTQLRNAQIEMSKSFTPVIEFPTAQQQQTFSLQMDLSSLYIYGLSSSGALLANAPLRWTDLAPYTQRSPRQQLNGCNTCQLLTAVAAAIGTDGFSVPVVVLQTKLNANGYRLIVNYNATLPNSQSTASNTIVVGASRRLLQSGGAGSGYQQSGTSSIDFYYINNGTFWTYGPSIAPGINMGGTTVLWSVLVTSLALLGGGGIAVGLKLAVV